MNKNEKITKLICILYAIGAINIFGGWGLWPLSSTHTSNTIICIFTWGIDINKLLLFFIYVINMTIIIGATIACCMGKDTIKILGYVIIVEYVLSDIIGNIYNKTFLIDGKGGTFTFPLVMSIIIDIFCIAIIMIEIVRKCKGIKVSKKNLTIIFLLSVLVICLAAFNMYLFICSTKLVF